MVVRRVPYFGEVWYLVVGLYPVGLGFVAVRGVRGFVPELGR